MPLAVDPFGYSPFLVTKNAALGIGVAVLLPLFALARFKQGSPYPRPALVALPGTHAAGGAPRFLAPIALSYWAWAILVGALGAPNLRLHALNAIRLTDYLVVFLVVAAGTAAVGTARPLYRLMDAIALSVVVMAAYAWLQALGMDPLVSWTGAPAVATGRWRLFTTAGNPDWTAEYLAAAGPIAAWSAGRLRRNLAAWVWLLITGGVIATGSRLGVLALVIVIGGPALLRAIVAIAHRHAGSSSGPAPVSRFRSEWLSLRGAIFLAVLSTVLLAYWGGTWGVGDVVARWSDFGSVSGRWILARAALALTGSHPVTGNGLGQFAPLLPQGLRRVVPTLDPSWSDLLPDQLVTHVHNDYLEVAFESGLPGAALLLALVVTGLAASLSGNQAAGRTEDGLPGALPGALGRALGALAFLAVGSAPLHNAPTALLFWMVLGSLAALRKPRPSAAPAPGAARPLPRVAACLAIVLASGLSFWPAVTALHANHLEAAALAASVGGQDRTADALHERALALAPWEYRSALALASRALAHGDPSTALHLAEHADRWAASRESWLIQAAALERRGDHRGAISVLEDALSALPDFLGARFALANLYASTGRGEAAARNYLEIMASRQTSATARALESEARQALEQLDR